jgi:hypothetical protein
MTEMAGILLPLLNVKYFIFSSIECFRGGLLLGVIRNYLSLQGDFGVISIGDTFRPASFLDYDKAPQLHDLS